MRWTTIGLVGLLAGFITWQSGPLFDLKPYPPDDGTPMYNSFWYDAMIFAIYAPFLVAVIGGTLAVFRALWLSTRRAELASLIALGRTRRSLIGDHVRAGLLDGLIASAAIVIAGAIRQAVTGVSGVEFVPFTAANYLVLFGIVLASFVMAYWIAAGWATRGSVRDVASGHRADARAKSRTSGKSRGRKRVWWWIAGAVALAWAAFALASSFGVGAGNESWGFVRAGGYALLMVAGFVGIPLLLAWAGAKLAAWFARGVSRNLGRAAEPGSSWSLAREGLTRTTPLRTAATVTVVLVMGTSVAITATAFASSDMSETADQLVPPAHVSTVDLQEGPGLQGSHEPGWVTALPQDVIDALHADPALIVVEAGVLITDKDPNARHGEQRSYWPHGMYIAVNPQSLDAVIPDAWKRLYMGDGVVDPWGQYGWSENLDESAQYLIVNGKRTDITWARDHAPWSGMSRTWAEDVWGPAPTATALLYPAGEQSVVNALAAHELRGLPVTTRDASFGWESSTSSGTVAAITGPFLAVAVAIVITLAWSEQRLRARDQATLLALGATPGALRGAAALESGILTLVAATVGVVVGATLGSVWAVVTVAPWGAVDADLVWWNIGQNVGLIPWVTVISLALGAAVIAATGALLVRVRLDRLTPAQQLTEAQKSGIS